MNSIERVEAALNFDSPDKVPTWGLGNTSDIFVQIMVPSKDWKPIGNPDGGKKKKDYFPILEMIC